MNFGLFDKIFNSKFKYRTVQFSLYNLSEDPGQLDLFSTHIVEVKRQTIYSIVDDINKKYGKHAIHLGVTDYAIQDGDHLGDRGHLAWRKKEENWLPGETKRKIVNLPYCGYVR